MRTISLTKGYIALIDDDDYEWLNQWSWCAAESSNGVVYALRKDKKRRTIRMHRLILNAPKGIEVDHVDRNGLNNQNSNLRYATRTQNKANETRRKDNKSGYKGVYFDKEPRRAARPWIANLQGKKLGRFATPEEAFTAYIKASKAMFGEFARAV